MVRVMLGGLGGRAFLNTCKSEPGVSLDESAFSRAPSCSLRSTHFSYGHGEEKDVSVRLGVGSIVFLFGQHQS
jgi:hypothetical protein